MMKRVSTLAIAIAAAAVMGLAGNASALTNILVESFELPETDPGSAYTLNGLGFSAGFDFYVRSSDWGLGATSPARDDFEVGNGNFQVGGQDFDNVNTRPNPVTLTVGSANIAGAANLGVSLMVGALNDQPAFSNYEALDGDGIKVFARIDAGPQVLIGAFAPPVGGAGDLLEDTNFDGIGDGRRLTRTLSTFQFPIAGAGNSLAIDVVMGSSGSFEMEVIDLVRIQKDIPEPASLALIGLGGLAMLRRRR